MTRYYYSQKAHISLVGQVSVCLYTIITAENLHAPPTPVVTLDMNAL